MIMAEEWWSFVVKGDCTYFKLGSLHKYKRVARGQDGVVVKIMIDLLLVKRDIPRYVQDVKAVRGMGRGISDHHVKSG